MQKPNLIHSTLSLRFALSLSFNSLSKQVIRHGFLCALPYSIGIVGTRYIFHLHISRMVCYSGGMVTQNPILRQVPRFSLKMGLRLFYICCQMFGIFEDFSKFCTIFTVLHFEISSNMGEFDKKSRHPLFDLPSTHLSTVLLVPPNPGFEHLFPPLSSMLASCSDETTAIKEL